ncbi:MAG: hypothetical protein BKP49_02985 [Treponema sp. CETP13]|nr:MAG: hypothetical protein BKP49_02985 [Treponema sp. CETP13]
MSVLTSKVIDTYYEKYRDKEIMFSSEVTKALYLMPRQIFVKCGGDQWPCIINSSSLSFVRIIIGTLGGAFKKLTNSKNEIVSIRFSFYEPEGNVVSFFVNAHISEISKFNGNQELALFTLTFSQRPPNALIERIGQILEANKNSNRRKEERIILNESVIRKLQLDNSKTELYIEKVPRKSILRDISFSGAKVIVVGIAKFLQDKSVVLSLNFEDPQEKILLQGKVINIQKIDGRAELITISIHFENPSLLYKIRLSNYFSSLLPRPNSNKNEETENVEQKPIDEEKKTLSAPSIEAHKE